MSLSGGDHDPIRCFFRLQITYPFPRSLSESSLFCRDTDLHKREKHKPFPSSKSPISLTRWHMGS